MPYSPILAPVVALVAWSLVMLVWMAIARRGAFAKLGIGWGSIPRGSRGVNLEGKAPDEAQWPSHNYMHLMEQPTLFYAVAISLAVLGDQSVLSVALAWSYVALRVVHSLVQVSWNNIQTRFALFFISSLLLFGLVYQAAVRVF